MFFRRQGAVVFQLVGFYSAPESMTEAPLTRLHGSSRNPDPESREIF